MVDAGPYRQRGQLLACPRCGEVLDRGLPRVHVCLRCEGVWLPQATVTAAFEDPRWPGGPAVWWRNSINCPECASAGETRMLEARMSHEVVVDRCPSHGVWLDRGELGRLMGVSSDELVALQRRLHLPAGDVDELAKRRRKWLDDFETRRAATAEYAAWLEEVERQREATLAERRRQELERTGELAKQRQDDALAREQRQRTRQELGGSLAELSQQRAKLARDHQLLAAELEAKRKQVDGIAWELRLIDERMKEAEAQLAVLDKVDSHGR